MIYKVRFVKDSGMADKNKNTLYYNQLQRRLIASLLANSSQVARVLELLMPEDFEEPALELVYTAIMDLSRRNEEITAVSIVAELERTGLLEKVGGISEMYLLRDEGSKYLLEGTPELYARMVKESSAKTKLKKIVGSFSEVFKQDSGVSAQDGISELQTTLNGELFKLSDESNTVTMSDGFDSYLDIVQQRIEIAKANEGAAQGLQGIPSLIPSINYFTTGWLPGQMITIAARTGVGKSVFAVNSAVAAAQAGKSVLFFSLEMGDAEIMDRITSSTTGVFLKRLREGGLTEDDFERLREASGDLKKMKIKLETDAKVTVESIRAKALRQAQSEMGLDFIIIDYLGLLTPVGKFSSRQEAVADMSRNVKILAKQLGVPIMVLAQVNRKSNADENDLPGIHNLRESGGIAQDSDVVILIHRDDSTDGNMPHTLLLLEKNRNGESNKTIRCHSNLECSLFREVVRAKEVERLDDDEVEQMVDDLDLEEFGMLSEDLEDFEFTEGEGF